MTYCYKNAKKKTLFFGKKQIAKTKLMLVDKSNWTSTIIWQKDYSPSGVSAIVLDAISDLTISLVNFSTNAKAFFSGKSMSDEATK